MEPAQILQPDPRSSATIEPCPTPLEWHDVLSRFRRDRNDFELDVAGKCVHGAESGSGHPLYFVNPAIGDSDQFALLAWVLREQFRCVFINYPRPSREKQSRLQEAATAIEAAADRCHDEQFSLVASGWGSLVALQMLLSDPDRIQAAVLICGYANRELTWLERGLLAWGGLCPGTLANLPGWQAVQEQNHRPWFPPFDESRWHFLRDNLGATQIREAARRLAILPMTDLRPRLSGIKVPVLLVQTEGEGPLLTKCQQELQAGLPAATREWLHTSGHYPGLTHPHRLAKLIRSFVSEHLTNRSEQ